MRRVTDAPSTTPPAKPAPQPDAVSQPYWDGLAQGVLRFQRCCGCGKVRHYPRLVCDACYSMDVEWIESAGRGALHSWTVAHHAFHPSFAEDLPYTNVVVDFPEGVRVLGRLHGLAPEALRVGLPLKFRAERRPDGVVLPAFEPA